MDATKHLSASKLEEGVDHILATPKDEAARGGSVMLQLSETTDPVALVDGLRGEDVHVDCRGRILRISPGAVTRGQHVDRLFDSLKAYI